MGYTVVELTTRAQLKELREQRRDFVIKATASWCRPCKAIQPLVLSLMARLPRSPLLVIVDVNRGPDLSSFLKIKAVPAFFSYINGEPMFSYLGCDVQGVRSFFGKTATKMGGCLPVLAEGLEEEDDN